MRKQEQSRLAELDAEKVNYELIQTQGDIDRLRKMAEEQRNLIQEQNQRQAQVLRFEDELARKRMQTDHEDQRRHNVELVQMQEKSFVRKEQARKDSEEQMQAQKLLTEQKKAEIDKETIRAKEKANAEKRIRLKVLTEEQNRRELKDKLQGETDKWIAAINATFSHIEGMPTDKNILLRNQNS